MLELEAEFWLTKAAAADAALSVALSVEIVAWAVAVSFDAKAAASLLAALLTEASIASVWLEVAPVVLKKLELLISTVS